jgi:hypothetical protein
MIRRTDVMMFRLFSGKRAIAGRGCMGFAKWSSSSCKAFLASTVDEKLLRALIPELDQARLNHLTRDKGKFPLKGCVPVRGWILSSTTSKQCSPTSKQCSPQKPAVRRENRLLLGFGFRRFARGAALSPGFPRAPAGVARGRGRRRAPPRPRLARGLALLSRLPCARAAAPVTERVLFATEAGLCLNADPSHPSGRATEGRFAVLLNS